MPNDVEGAPQRFREFRDHADELLRLAMKTEKDPRLMEVPSFSDLLQGLLPRTESGQTHVAKALQMEPSDLAALQRGELDPFLFPQNPLVTLAQVAGLDLEQFKTMIGADHERLLRYKAPANGLYVPISARATMGAEEVFAEVERLWEQSDEAVL